MSTAEVIIDHGVDEGIVAARMVTSLAASRTGCVLSMLCDKVDSIARLVRVCMTSNVWLWVLRKIWRRRPG